MQFNDTELSPSFISLNKHPLSFVLLFLLFYVCENMNIQFHVEFLWQWFVTAFFSPLLFNKPR